MSTTGKAVVGGSGAKRRRRLVFGVAAAVSGLVLAACGGGGSDDSDGPIKARIAAYHDESTAIVQAMDWWATQVEERSDGAIEFDRFYGGALLDATGMRDGVAAGQVEVGNFSPGYHPGDFPLTEGLFTVPFTTTNPGAAMDALRELYRDTPEAQAEYRDQGIEMISPIAASEGALGTDKPINAVTDLEGMAIRGYEGGGINTGLRAVGARPTDLDVAEIYESMQRGVINGFASLIVDAAVNLSLDEVTDHWTQAGFGVVASTSIAANSEWFDGLPQDLQDIMLETADEMTAEYMVLLEAAEQSACEALDAAGREVSALSETEQERWRDMIGEEQLAKFEADAGERLDDPASYFDAFAKAVAAAESKYPGESGIGRCVK